RPATQLTVPHSSTPTVATRAPPSFPTRRSSDLLATRLLVVEQGRLVQSGTPAEVTAHPRSRYVADLVGVAGAWVSGHLRRRPRLDRKSTRLNSSHVKISYAVFCLKKKKYIRYTK